MPPSASRSALPCLLALAVLPALAWGQTSSTSTAPALPASRPVSRPATQPAPPASRPFTRPATQPVELAITAGPVLGARGDDYITVSCRTNLPATVTLRIVGGVADPNATTDAERQNLLWHETADTSPLGLHHQFRVSGLTGLVSAAYQLEGQSPTPPSIAGAGPSSLMPLPIAPDPLRFVVLGDVRTNPPDWPMVAMAVLKARPHFLVFVGDLIEPVRQNPNWPREYLDTASTLLATVPSFVAPSQIRRDPPVAGLFAPPPDATPARWQQTVGPVHLIGIDAQADWSPASANVAWLEGALAESRSGFLFLITRYPPRPAISRDTLKALMPLLARHHATAVIAGQDRPYERTKDPSGVSVINIAGDPFPPPAPVPLDQAMDPSVPLTSPAAQYCLFTVDAGTCTMIVTTPDDRELDSCSWPSRPEAPPAPPPTTSPADESLTTPPTGQ